MTSEHTHTFIFECQVLKELPVNTTYSGTSRCFNGMLSILFCLFTLISIMNLNPFVITTMFRIRKLLYNMWEYNNSVN